MTSISEFRKMYYYGIKKFLKNHSVSIFRVDMTRIDKLNEI